MQTKTSKPNLKATYLRKMETKKPSKHGHFHESLWPVLQANWKFTAHHDGVGNYQYEKQKTADRIENLHRVYCRDSLIRVKIYIHIVLHIFEHDITIQQDPFQLESTNLGISWSKRVNIPTSSFKFSLECLENIKPWNLAYDEVHKTNKKNPSCSCQIQDPRPRNLSAFEDNVQIP